VEYSQFGLGQRTCLLLPVWQRVNYKIVTLVHRRLSGHVPSYLADDCRLVNDAGVRRLRSADTRTLVVGRTQSSFGDRTLAAAAPRLWNSLPPDIMTCQFTWSIKSFHFGQQDHGAVRPNCALETFLLCLFVQTTLNDNFKTFKT